MKLAVDAIGAADSLREKLVEAKDREEYFFARWQERLLKNADLKQNIDHLEARNEDLERMLSGEIRQRQELQAALEAQSVDELLTRLKNQSATIARLQGEVEGLTHALHKQKESAPKPPNPPEIRVTVSTECRTLLSLNCKLQGSYTGHDYYRGDAGTATWPCVVRLYVPNTACQTNN